VRIQQEDLGALKDRLQMSIDVQAEAIRGRYITRGAGQAMAYQRKEQEARDLITGVNPIPGPHLMAEANVRGVTALDVAEAIVQLADQWAMVSAAIEAERLRAKWNIAGATTVREARLAFDAVAWPE
jgi:hypothetical protein